MMEMKAYLRKTLNEISGYEGSAVGCLQDQVIIYKLLILIFFKSLGKYIT